MPRFERQGDFVETTDPWLARYTHSSPPPRRTISCTNPFHVFCLETEASTTVTSTTSSILPHIRCPTCSAHIQGRCIPIRAIHVFHTPSGTLRPIHDTAKGNTQDEWTNRPHYRGRELIMNPSCLASVKVTCALCLEDIWPAEDKVVHFDTSEACLAVFHLHCFDSCLLDAHHCPTCRASVTEESEAETEHKLADDERIQQGLRPPRSPPASLTACAIQHNACVFRSQAHPFYYDLHSHKGAAPNRAKVCIICRNEIDSHEDTWIHIDTCNNAFHAHCLPCWIEYKQQKQREVDDDQKDDWRPDCPICRAIFMERPVAPAHGAVEFGSAEIETRFDHLPEEIRAEVLRREEDDFDEWPMVIWTDRLHPE